MNICYILDGLLMLYGLILTALYCRLRMQTVDKPPAQNKEKKPVEGGVYEGLYAPSTDVYETINAKKPFV